MGAERWAPRSECKLYSSEPVVVGSAHEDRGEVATLAATTGVRAAAQQGAEGEVASLDSRGGQERVPGSVEV